jgi:hypothetical protein
MGQGHEPRSVRHRLIDVPGSGDRFTSNRSPDHDSKHHASRCPRPGDPARLSRGSLTGGSVAAHTVTRGNVRQLPHQVWRISALLRCGADRTRTDDFLLAKQGQRLGRPAETGRNPCAVWRSGSRLLSSVHVVFGSLADDPRTPTRWVVSLCPPLFFFRPPPLLKPSRRRGPGQGRRKPSRRDAERRGAALTGVPEAYDRPGGG